MYQTEINTRDLFYSNPADHFLSNDRKISAESGFSSSFGYSQSGNSKELLNSTSQDLFNLTPKISGCEGQTSNTDYQKYISQNLLFNKKGKTLRNLCIGRNESQWDNEEISLKTTEKQNENDYNEIKTLIGNFHGGIRKLDTDISEVKDNVKRMATEISKQNERIGSLRELLQKQERMIEEINENCKESNEKADNNMIKMQKTLNENIKGIKNAVDKSKSAMETSQTKILENIRKNLTSQPSTNKKSTEQFKRSNEEFMRNIEIKINDMHTSFESYLKEIKNHYEEKLQGNVHVLKTLINSSHLKLKEMISSQKIQEPKSRLYGNNNESAKQAEENIFESARSEFFNRARPNTNFNSNYEWQNSKPYSVAQRSVHTPLVEIINHQNTISLANQNLKDRPPSGTRQVNISSYHSPKRQLPRACKQNHSQQSSQLNFKRKVTTPTLQTKQPMKKNLRSSVNWDSKLLTNVNCSRTATMRKNSNVDVSNMRNRQQYVKVTKADTALSSPYLSLYEAKMVEDFIFP